MTQFSDEHLNKFRADSDQAFRAMQMSADREMASFLRKYDGPIDEFAPFDVASTSSSTPVTQRTVKHRLSRQRAAGPTSLDGSGSVEGSLFPEEQAPSLFGQAAASMNLQNLDRAHLADSVADLKSDAGQLASNFREESRASIYDAARSTSQILKKSASGLGQRAKAEAEALRNAAQDAAKEERSLKSMRNRAREELLKAKARVESQLQEAKADVSDELQGLAQNKFEKLKGSARRTLQAGQDSLSQEFDDLSTGRDAH